MASKLDPHKGAVAAHLVKGYSINEIAHVYGVSRDTAQRFVKKHFSENVGTGEYRNDGLTQDPEDGPILVVHRDYTHLPALHTYPLGDLHIGSPQCAEEALDQWLDYLVATDGVSMLNTGDNFNSALRDSVSDVYKEKYTVETARQLLTAKLEPLVEKGILDGVIDGNHENRIIRAVGDSPNSAMADVLGIPYASASLLVVYHVGDQEYNLFLRHGRGGGATMGAAVNNLEKQERIIDADIYVSGHIHTQVAFPKDIFVREGNRVVRKKRLFVCSGSFLGWEPYAAVAGYPPAHIGAPRIFMDGRKHDTHASV